MFQGSVPFFTSGCYILLVWALIRTAGGAGQHESEWRNLSSRDLCDFFRAQAACASTGEHSIVFIRHGFLLFGFGSFSNLGKHRRAMVIFRVLHHDNLRGLCCVKTEAPVPAARASAFCISVVSKTA